MKPTSFTIIFDRDGKLESHDSTSTVFSDNYCSLSVRLLNDYYIKYQSSKNGFLLFIGEYVSTITKPGGDAPFGQGSYVYYDSRRRSLTIESDVLGTSIIYYQELGSLLKVSNRLENLLLKESSINWCAIQQYLNSGYTISSDTFFSNIHQTLPNQSLTINYNRNLTAEARNDEWKCELKHLSLQDLSEKASHRLSAILQSKMRSTLMMSAGWDSRTLLSSGPSNYNAAYTHGDLSSREIFIAHGLTRAQRLNHHFIDSKSFALDSGLLDEMLEELGFCVFPIWYTSSTLISLMKNGPISSGVLGELFGGHYGLLSIGNRAQKFLSAISIVDESLLSQRKITEKIKQFSAPHAEHWFLNPSYNALFQEIAPATKSKMLSKLLELRSEEGGWQEGLESFNMQHRARQYIVKQAQAASSTTGYILPFGDDELTKIVKAIPFKHRIHNRLNKLILSSKSPDLLRAPMAATLIGARYPIILQELSRVVRILLEESAKGLGLSPPRLGWFNYEHIYQSDTFQELVTSLKHEMWDRKRMLETISKNISRGIDAGSTLDMLCKIKTVDYYLTLYNQQSCDRNHEKVS